MLGMIAAIAMIEAAGLAAVTLLACRLSGSSIDASMEGETVLLTTSLALTMISTAGGYSPKLILRRAPFLRAGIIGTCAAFAAMSAILLVFRTQAISPLALGGGGVIALGVVAATRRGVARLLAGHTARRYAMRTVLVGRGTVAAGLLLVGGCGDDIAPEWLGYIDDQSSEPPADGLPYLGGLPRLLELIRDGAVDQVIIALPWSARSPVLELIRRLAEYPVRVRLAPDFERRDLHHRDRDRPPALIDLTEPPLSGWTSLVKRAEDVFLGVLALIVFAIPMLIVAVTVRLDSPGPALFRQRRTGFNNRDFEMLKFRTMQHRFADADGSRQAVHDDPRITRVGFFLRRTSLDELPQIFNALAGDMSIVGPRPHAPGTRAGGRLFDEVVADYASRHRVRPGLTGLAQVRGLRGPTDTEDRLARRVDSDLEYIERWSLWLDLKVLLRTAIVVIRRTNAY